MQGENIRIWFLASTGWWEGRGVVGAALQEWDPRCNAARCVKKGKKREKLEENADFLQVWVQAEAVPAPCSLCACWALPSTFQPLHCEEQARAPSEPHFPGRMEKHHVLEMEMPISGSEGKRGTACGLCKLQEK